MVHLICGPNGSGKTQKIINLANEELTKSHGLIVYIDKSDKYRRSINNMIKFINARDFKLDNTDLFYGFLCGILSGNYDINRVYIDNLKEIINISSSDEMTKFVKSIKTLSDEFGTHFYLTVTTDDEEASELSVIVFSDGQ